MTVFVACLAHQWIPTRCVWKKKPARWFWSTACLFTAFHHKCFQFRKMADNLDEDKTATKLIQRQMTEALNIWMGDHPNRTTHICCKHVHLKTVPEIYVPLQQNALCTVRQAGQLGENKGGGVMLLIKSSAVKAIRSTACRVAVGWGDTSMGRRGKRKVTHQPPVKPQTASNLSVICPFWVRDQQTLQCNGWKLGQINKLLIKILGVVWVSQNDVKCLEITKVTIYIESGEKSDGTLSRTKNNKSVFKTDLVACCHFCDVIP